MSIKVIYDSYSDICKDYVYGKRFLDEPEKVIERLNRHFDGVEFDDCWLYPDVSTDRDLGEYIVDEIGFELSREKLERYFDYEKFGRDVRLEEGGSFVDKGYFVSR